MTTEQIAERLYLLDGIRDADFLNSILSDKFEFEWDSSQGLSRMNKDEIIKYVQELKENYHTSKVSILDQIITENKIAVRYLHHVSSIENPNELFTIAKIFVFWDIENGKIINGYQMSKPL